jgi:probable phosphoglycerate mutase
MRLILVRHGQTRWNEERRIQGGGSDNALDETGRHQAARVAQALKNHPLEAIYSSPMKRALDTARSIARRHHLPVTVDPDLREADMGEIDGLTIDELMQEFGEFWQEWRTSIGTAQFPGGESMQSLGQRVEEAFQRIRRSHPQGTVVVVGHTFALGTALVRFLGLELTHFRRFRLETASITVLDLGDDGATLVCLNDTCHWKEE